MNPSYLLYQYDLGGAYFYSEKYEEAKKKRASKKKQTIVQVKEVKLRPKTDTHDVDVKARATLRMRCSRCRMS